MGNPVKHVVAPGGMASYLAARPIDAPIFLDGRLIQAGFGAPIEYYTHKNGTIHLLPESKPIN
jgi:hypothetical protein